MYFEKVIFRVRGGLVSGQPRGLRSADSKNLAAGYLTVTSKSAAKDMQKKHEVMRTPKKEAGLFRCCRWDWLALKNAFFPVSATGAFTPTPYTQTPNFRSRYEGHGFHRVSGNG
jgi:hypothetical protein